LVVVAHREDGDESVRRRRISAAMTNFAETYESAFALSTDPANQNAEPFFSSPTLPLPNPHFSFSLLPLLLPPFFCNHADVRKKKEKKRKKKERFSLGSLLHRPRL
jgi:hypothetical protein